MEKGSWWRSIDMKFDLPTAVISAYSLCSDGSHEVRGGPKQDLQAQSSWKKACESCGSTSSRRHCHSTCVISTAYAPPSNDLRRSRFCTTRHGHRTRHNRSFEKLSSNSSFLKLSSPCMVSTTTVAHYPRVYTIVCIIPATFSIEFLNTTRLIRVPSDYPVN